MVHLTEIAPPLSINRFEVEPASFARNGFTGLAQGLNLLAT